MVAHVQEVLCFLATQAAAIQSKVVRGPGEVRVQAVQSGVDVAVAAHAPAMRQRLFPYSQPHSSRVLHRPPVRREDESQMVEVGTESWSGWNRREARLYHSSRLVPSLAQPAGSSFGGEGRRSLLIWRRQRGVLHQAQHQAQLSNYDLSRCDCWKSCWKSCRYFLNCSPRNRQHF